MTNPTPQSIAAACRALAPDLLALADLDDPQLGPLVQNYTGPLGEHLQWENNDFTLATPQTVAFGPSDGPVAGPFVSRFLPAGTYHCGTSFFGDPAPGKYKAVFAVPA